MTRVSAHMPTAALLFAFAGGVVAAACGPTDAPPPVSARSASVTATTPVSSSPPRGDVRAPKPLGPLTNATADERTRAVLDLLSGKGEGAFVPEVVTDPGQSFDSDLRRSLLEPPATPRLKLGSIDVKGSLARDVVSRSLRTSMGAFRLCYDHARERSPGAHGKVALAFTISADGAATQVRRTGGDLGDKALSQCLIEAVQRRSFPKPEDGTVTVAFDVSFDPPA